VLRRLGIRHEKNHLATLGAFVDEETTGCISFGALMNFPVTLATQSDQVVRGILALMAPESLMMNFDCGKRAAGLAAPPVALQYLFA